MGVTLVVVVGGGGCIGFDFNPKPHSHHTMAIPTVMGLGKSPPTLIIFLLSLVADQHGGMEIGVGAWGFDLMKKVEGVVAMESSHMLCVRTQEPELREIREIKVEDDPSELHLLDKRDWDPCQDDQMVDLFSFVTSLVVGYIAPMVSEGGLVVGDLAPKIDASGLVSGDSTL
ncbi:hypothetical protein SO802_024121 [Lithocarpus litseifolius]|uniref:Uncharacterized protein n=1 Tax=Lithocarpus litseifolius TaxID=425828 RepID=A0AAW2C8M1_9ROSI